jgi:hypothetical protein
MVRPDRQPDAGASEEILDRPSAAFTSTTVRGDRYPEYAAEWLDHGSPPLAEG